MGVRKMVKLLILGEMLEGKEPFVGDYEGEDGLEKGEFNKLIAEMQDKDRFIEGVVFAKSSKELLVAFFSSARVTPRGESYYETEILKIK
ncbi:hypothetical protein ABE288_22520 [Bacillus salipaludis]|uniref:hypothetical protein n=1 Tax=Bacillus salipaludis TaxID=2547811 RepID=UPI003D1968FC